MSAPSPCYVTQTPQREFAMQNYTKKMTLANKSAIFMHFCIFSSFMSSCLTSVSDDGLTLNYTCV